MVLPANVAGAASSLPADIGSMSMAAIKAFVVEHRMEDEEFMRLNGSRAKKADFVAYLRRRMGRT